MQGIPGMYQPYKGNTLNCAERARFDFPEKSWNGQPVGVTLSGSSDKHQHSILIKADPTYLPSPTHDMILSQTLGMPEIKGGSPQQQPSNYMGSSSNYQQQPQGQANVNMNSGGSSPNKRFEQSAAYLEKLRRQAEEKQYSLQMAEREKMKYKTNHEQKLSLDQFNAAQGHTNSNLIGSKSSPNISPEKLDAIAMKRNKQISHALAIESSAKAQEIPQGHAILLHQPRRLEGNPNAAAQGVLSGTGQLNNNISNNEKRQQQEQYRQALQQGAALQEPNTTRAPPKRRPVSPSVPIPGQNGLMTLGSLDSPQSKQKAKENMQYMLAKQTREIEAYKAMKEAGGTQNLRSSDEYGLTSSRSGQVSERSPHGQYPLLVNPKKVSVPERDPNAYFPSPMVREAKSRQHEAQMSRQGFPGSDGIIDGDSGTNSSQILSQENYARRKLQQEMYKNQMAADAAAKQNVETSRIPLQFISTKGANNRNEQALFSPVRSGPNVIDSVGDYDYDHHDKNKKREMQAEYHAQLVAAEQATVPIGQSQARTPLTNQQVPLHPDPFKPSAQYQESLNVQYEGNTSLPLQGSEEYNGYSRGGFNQNDPIYKQMRVMEREKQEEFRAKVESQSNEIVQSPRGTLYRRKYLGAPDYDTTTQFGMLTNSLAKNEDLLEEKGIQEGSKRMAQELRVQQLEADKLMHETVRNTPQQRHSFAKKPMSENEIHQDLSDNYIPPGIPMHNQYDWNEKSLDYNWNSDQTPDQIGTGRSGYAKPHATHQMYFAQGGATANTAGIVEQYDNGSAVNTSLPFSSRDMEKTVHAMNRIQYTEGVLSDRSEKARQQYIEEMKKFQAMQEARDPTGQAAYHHVPKLDITQQIPVHNPNYHNPSYGGAGLDPVSGISALANGRQPQVPPGSKPQSSFPEPRRIGGEALLPRNNRVIERPATDAMRTPQQTGFRSQRS
jgi:hypothetical protein